MISPKELKNKTFSTSFHGYTKVEVDSYITSLIAQYTELYRAYEDVKAKQAETEATLAEANAELAERRESEDAIRRALVSAQNASAKMIENAKAKSEELERISREKCGEVIAEFREHVSEERERLNTLRAQTADFKNRLFSQYQEHIRLLEETTAGLDEQDWDLSPTDATRSVLSLLRGEIDRRTRNDEREEEKLDSEIDGAIGEIGAITDKEQAEEAF